MADFQEKYLKQLLSFFWENGFNPDSMQTERLAYYTDLLTKKNEFLNLVSRKDIESIVENHVFL